MDAQDRQDKWVKPPSPILTILFIHVKFLSLKVLYELFEFGFIQDF